MSIVINGKDLVVHFRGQRIGARTPLVIDGSPPRPPSYYDRASTSGWRTHPAFPPTEILYDESARLTPELWDRAMAIRRARYA